jgi:cation diffusion facilitator CzcD-associated flavoprotein CzcO
MHTMAAPADARVVRLVIIGGGFSGIGMAIRLRQQGIEDFVILERAHDAGGTWRDNSYPGCACDVQSSLYSFSFAPNPEWSRSFSPQPEIWAYLRQCVRDFDIERHFVFDQTVTGAVWDEVPQQWTVTTTSTTTSTTATWRADAVVMASGALSDPILPAIPGIDGFAGPLFHSARWDHGIDLRGRRVAVIGTGASAIQFIPEIQPCVASLAIFQRTPPWILPRHDRAVPEWRKALYRARPLTQRLQRAALYAMRESLVHAFHHRALARVVEWRARTFMESQISDPVLRTKLVPDYQIGCKRILVSDDYYPALQRSNVSLVTARIRAIEPAAIVTADGASHPADVIILATGFRPTDPPLAPVIVGRDGRSLADVWHGSPTAYMGTTTSGFPNFFMLLGPNTALGHSSVMLMVEAQIDHILGVLRQLALRGAGAADPDPVAQRAYVAMIDARLATSTWNAGGCSSWYLDRTGRNSTLWPDGVGRFRRTVAHVHADAYRWLPRRSSPAPVTANV